MKNNTLIHLLVISLFVVTSCEKNNDQHNNQIIGSWEWIKSTYPRPEFITTPATVGYNETRIFKANDTVEIYINSSIKDIYYYEFKYRNLIFPDIPSTDSTLMLVINGRASFFSIDNNTLIIDYSYVDGTTDYYKRQ